ncbi:acyltransferase family protein [Modestobacter versicolor]|uniref:acyltransferase family protein n=1 Tax=Modestobacter versicolor TaxID=429133 RepID=UPI0034DE001C
MTTSAAAARTTDGAAQRHLNALTGMRLVAALAVWASHVGAPAGTPEWLVRLMSTGYVGVTFFFVLSGFVLTINYAEGLRTPRAVWSYLVARLARIYPVYLAILGWTVATEWATGPVSGRVVAVHTLGLQAWSPDMDVTFAFVGPAWSISVELFLYLTLPVLLPVVRLVTGRLATIVLALLATAAVLVLLAWWFQHQGLGALPASDPTSAHRWLYRTPLVRVGDFLIGILAAFVYLRVRDSLAAQRAGAWLAVTAVVFTVATAALPGTSWSVWSWDALYALPAAALVLGLALAPRHPMARFLGLRPMVFLGEVSFAFYLVHVTAVHMIGVAVPAQEGLGPQLVVRFAGLALALGLAVGLHIGIERPARPWVRRVLDPRPAPRPAPRRDAAAAAPAATVLPVPAAGPATVTMAAVQVPRPRAAQPPAGRPAVPVDQVVASARAAALLKEYGGLPRPARSGRHEAPADSTETARTLVPR